MESFDEAVEVVEGSEEVAVVEEAVEVEADVAEVAAGEEVEEAAEVDEAVGYGKFAVAFTRSIRYSTSFWRSIFDTAFNRHIVI